MSRKNRRKKARNTAAVPEGTAEKEERTRSRSGPENLGLVPRRLCCPGLVLFCLIHPQLVGRRLCLYRPGYGSLALVFV